MRLQCRTTYPGEHNTVERWEPVEYDEDLDSVDLTVMLLMQNYSREYNLPARMVIICDEDGSRTEYRMTGSYEH